MAYKKTDNNFNQTENKTEDPFDQYLKANIVIKEDNGVMKKYVQRKGDSNHIGYMLEDVQLKDMYYKFQELSKDSQFKEKVSSMSAEDVAREVLDAIATDENRKKYYMESGFEQTSLDQRGSVAGGIAMQNNGLVNKEIGIVDNQTNSSNQYNNEQLQKRENVKARKKILSFPSSKSSGLVSIFGIVFILLLVTLTLSVIFINH